MTNNLNKTNHMTLEAAVKTLYVDQSIQSVRGIINRVMEDSEFQSIRNLCKYTSIYYAIKKLKGNKPSPKHLKVQKASIILDLTQKPLETVKGTVVNPGK